MDGEIYALKFDIKKYFYNIDHEILFNLLKKKIKDKDAINILTKIINSTDYDYVNKDIIKIKQRKINKISNKKLICEIERIPLYEKGKGLPIGNMTSQILAIFYLNELDHFIKEKLHIKYYIRYMDDGVLLSNDKEHLKYCLNEIIKILDEYKLEINNKTKIINVSKEGLDFLGFRFYKNKKLYIKVRNSVKKRFKNKMKSNVSMDVINSYFSHLKFGNCYYLFKRNIKV